MNAVPGRKPAVRGDVDVPRATARLQFHEDFGFDQATALVPYFAALGVSHLYASPILKARPGSTHGYDCVDVSLVNPELGGEDAFRRLADAAHAAGLGIVVDIVPNHLGVGIDNAWWQDVLAWGPQSRYAHYFDIDWQSTDPALRGKMLAPFLGDGYGEVLASGDLVLAFDTARGFEVRYFDNRFPVAVADYAALLDGTGHAALGDVARLFEATAQLGDVGPATQRVALLEQRDAALAKARESLATVMSNAGAREAVERSLARYATDTPEGRSRLHALLERQSYRLASWRVAAEEINWRRFFEVTELAGVRVEQDDVFDAMHATIFRLYREGAIDSVRVDHVDGLADPRAYCRTLQRRLTEMRDERPASRWHRPWIVVEKILAAHEDLRDDWKIDGTSGYDFMNEVGALLHDGRAAEPLAAFWSAKTLRPADFKSEQVAARRQILAENLASEFGATARALHRVARSDIDTRDVGLIMIQRALTELLVQFEVYRTYVDARGRSAADTAVLVAALRAAHETTRPSDRPVLAWLDHWLGGDAADAGPNDALQEGPTRHRKSDRRRAITRFQQLTPPLAAKSVEDTAFYRYGRLISRNEVGADPGDFALTIDAFHAKCLRRAGSFPNAMLATATHDHKRGADTRARLAVLSEMPQQWIATVDRWTTLNTPVATRAKQAEDVIAENAPMVPPSGLAAKGRAVAESAAMPLPEDQLMLLQTLVGAWPLDLAGTIDAATSAPALAAFVERVAAWQVKALRETKRPSDWALPNDAYEATCRAYLDRIMDPADLFVREAAAFVASLGTAAAVNGLTQATLHCTVPGVPDLYQGTEWWDFSLVDPDNRRPVDYAARAAALRTLGESNGPLDAGPLLTSWGDGRIKQAVITKLLHLRAAKPALFARGDYEPLTVEGTEAARVLAFLRRDGADRVIVAVPVHVFGLLEGATVPLVSHERWGDTRIVLPPGTASNAWTDVMTGRRRKSAARRLDASELFEELPVAVLRDASRG